jgi:hypothetical protein
MGPPWWAWLLGILVAIGLGVGRAALRQRESLVAVIAAHLTRLRPDLTVVRSDGGGFLGSPWLAVRIPSGAEVTVPLAKLIGELTPRTPDEQAAILERWASALEG